MADLITIKSGSFGSRSTMPKLSVDELGYQNDEKALYIGTESGNVRLCGIEDVAKINELNATIQSLSTAIDDINARLDALTPSE